MVLSPEMLPRWVSHVTATLASSNASAMLRPFSRAVKNARVKTRAAGSQTCVSQHTTLGTPALCTALPRGSEQHPFRTTSSRLPPCSGVASPKIVAKSSGRTISSPPSGCVKPRVLGRRAVSPLEPLGDGASAWPAKSQRRVGRASSVRRSFAVPPSITSTTPEQSAATSFASERACGSGLMRPSSFGLHATMRRLRGSTVSGSCCPNHGSCSTERISCPLSKYERRRLGSESSNLRSRLIASLTSPLCTWPTSASLLFSEAGLHVESLCKSVDEMESS
eukprot:scaffold46953_cov62-Phaeocystis_antarctica.AAC.11